MSWPDRPNRDAHFDTEHVLLAGQTATLRPFKGAKLAFPCLGVENFSKSNNLIDREVWSISVI